MGNNGQMNGKFKEKKKRGQVAEKRSSRRLTYDSILDSLMTP
mgnify:CR=1 FL=1